MSQYFSKLKTAVIEFDPLNLGNSFILYSFLAFATFPAFVLFFPHIKPIASLLHSQPTSFSIYYYAFAIIGVLAFFLGFHYVRIGGFVGRMQSIWDYEWQPLRTFLVFFGVFAFGILIKAVRIYNGGFIYLDRNLAFTSHPLYSLVGLFDWMGTIALFIALIAYFYSLKTHDPWLVVWRYTAWAVFLIEVSYGFFSGARGTVLMPMVAYVIVRHYLFRKSPRYVFAAFMIIFFLLMPLLNINRSPGVFLTSYNVVTKEELIASRDALKELNSKKLLASISIFTPERITNLGKYAFDASVLRADQSRILLAVFNNVYEFKPWESAYKFIASLGPPRFIWKSKPIIQGNMSEIGWKSGLLAPGDTTSIGPTVVGNWYMNFGILGIVFGMFFLGAIFKFLSEVFISSENIYPTGLLIFGVTWLHTIPMAVEGWMAPLWAGYVKLFVILFVVHLALKGRRLSKK